jgi:hypothetical protein
MRCGSSGPSGESAREINNWRVKPADLAAGFHPFVPTIKKGRRFVPYPA